MSLRACDGIEKQFFLVSLKQCIHMESTHVTILKGEIVYFKLGSYFWRIVFGAGYPSCAIQMTCEINRVEIK